MRKSILLIFVTILVLGGCSMPTRYYTNPSSAGYHVQKLGGICKKCGKQFTFSGYQLHNQKTIKCYYCSHPQNIHRASERWVKLKARYNNQQAAGLLGSAIKGFANGYTGGSNSNSVNTYQASGCYSDYDCDTGERCVKPQMSSSGTCMTSVDKYGNPTYDLPSLDSQGVNTEKECSFDTDCPIGFECDQTHDACVKR